MTRLSFGSPGLLPPGRIVVGAALALVFCACSAPRRVHHRIDRRSDVITAAEIQHSSATNVWQLLRERAPRYRLEEDRHGEPASMRTRRGRSTIALAGGDDPLILIDGARVSDYRMLRQFPTASVALIRFESAIDGTVRQGTNASAGVIAITTKVLAPDDSI